MHKPLILYGTVGCHLCDEAEHILQTLSLPYCTVDIIDDPHLLDKFATDIPVLQIPSIEVYLYWPFTTAQVTHWLANTRP